MERKMRILLIALFCVSTGLLLIGCDDGCGCDLPRIGRDWFIEIDLGSIPDNITEYPILVDVGVRVRSLENGDPPADGFVVALSISPGAFDNGLPEIELPLVNGRASATMRIGFAGVYELTVRPQGQETSTVTTFNVGL